MSKSQQDFGRILLVSVHSYPNSYKNIYSERGNSGAQLRKAKIQSHTGKTKIYVHHNSIPHLWEILRISSLHMFVQLLLDQPPLLLTMYGQVMQLLTLLDQKLYLPESHTIQLSREERLANDLATQVQTPQTAISTSLRGNKINHTIRNFLTLTWFSYHFPTITTIFSTSTNLTTVHRIDIIKIIYIRHSSLFAMTDDSRPLC